MKWLKFLFHKYDIDQFHAEYCKDNIKTLLQWSTEVLDATQEGRLLLRKSRLLFFIKNLFFLGAYGARVKKVVLYTFIALSLELNNPVTKRVLQKYLQRKIALMERILAKIPWNKFGNKVELLFHIDRFERSSLLQQKISDNLREAVSKQKEPKPINKVKEAMKKGIQPILISQGLSGAYWMRDETRQIVGLFKPFDEEIFAPNNPIGPKLQGAIGQRTAYPGIRVGEAAFREVAAFLVDQFFGFGIVPKTYFAKFTHPIFFLSREERSGMKKPKTKMGSFQEYIEGVQPFLESNREIDPLELQLLAALDLIIGNLDRNTGNILLKDKKVVAIDHGLSFSDLPEALCTWYWVNIKGEELFPSLVKLFEEFPIEELSRHLKDRCFLTENVLARMKERITLFSEGLKITKKLNELAGLMAEEYLEPLMGLDESLREKAKVQVERYFGQGRGP